MSAPTAFQYMLPLAPRTANVLGAGSRIDVVAVTGVSSNVPLPALGADQTTPERRRRFVRLQADGANVYYAFSNDPASVINEATNGQPSVAGCMLLPSGQMIDHWIPPDLSRLVLKTVAPATGQVRIFWSST